MNTSVAKMNTSVTKMNTSVTKTNTSATKTNDEIEALYRRIGRSVAELVGGSFRKACVRVEMGDEYGSLGAFYDPGTGEFHYATGDDDALFDLFVDLRRRSIAAGMRTWSQATFTVDDAGKTNVDFGFDDISDMALDGERRQRWMAQNLGANARVIWSPA
jgi:YezG-like immunity protein